ncbi:hypothetical protein JJB99_31585 [Bradyrhizobium diazoefficiens]|uniref:hypothetical protein n=1 Tax=Bradyrhizobium diazoefficiens TaxID=1355477 RepID=UPI00190CA6C5|nr:hypothetical protein [Bradyrhizobium diazoefficiens]QQO13855.1 hypothetical protein JJB99_31585 [Bradyrhizobium diazoefficiens]
MSLPSNRRLVQQSRISSDRRPIEKVTEAMFQRSIGVHLARTLWTTQAAIAGMKRRSFGGVAPHFPDSNPSENALIKLTTLSYDDVEGSADGVWDHSSSLSRQANSDNFATAG